MNVTLVELADILEEVIYAIQTQDFDDLRVTIWRLRKNAEEEIEEIENE